MHDMTDMVRIAGLRGFDALVCQLRGDPAALLRRHHMPTRLDDEDVLVSARNVAQLLEDSAQRLRCPDFGLRLAQAQDIGILGPVAVAIQNEPTVGKALQTASDYLFVHNQGVAFTPFMGRYADADIAELRYEVPITVARAARQSIDLMLGGGHRILTLLCGDRYQLRAVNLPHSPKASRLVYQRYFGVTVRFDQPTASLVVPRALFDAPLPQANETLHRLAISYLQQNFDETHKSVLPRVRIAVRGALGTPFSGLESIARLLAMHPRTLQRHLADEGATFEAIRDTIVQEAALRYLGGSRLSLTEISARLGMSEQSALSRSCRRWFGESPTALRRRLLATALRLP